MAMKHNLAERYPGLGREKISAAKITDPDYFQLEKEHVFGKSWLQIGWMADLPKPGSYFVYDVPTLNESVIVTRDRESNVHAFRNFCTHRGMKLCPVGHHTGNRMSCPFHGWAFALNGDLAGLEGEEYFYNFDRKDYALKKVRVGVWEDLIFINFDADGTESLEDYLAELVDGFEGYWSVKDWERVAQYRWTLDFNWKLYLDSSVEGYHAAYVHLFNNTGQIASNNPAPLWLPEDTVRLYDRHRIVGIPQNVGERNLAPVEEFAFRYGQVTGYTAASREFPKNVNPTRREDFAFDILEMFPNGVFFNSGNLAGIIRLWPVSEKQTVCEVEVMLPPAQNWAARLSQEYGKVALRDVIREDMNTAAGIQQVARPTDEFVLGDQEIAVRHSYHSVDQAIQKALS